MIVPGDIVITAVGAFLTFFGLILSGTVPPVYLHNIYDSAFVEHTAAWLSVTRFFVEGLAGSEHRCFPEQNGWTVDVEAVVRPRSGTLTRSERFNYGMHDPNLTIYDCGGWYWGILPSIFVGITIRYLGFLAMVSRLASDDVQMMLNAGDTHNFLQRALNLDFVFDLPIQHGMNRGQQTKKPILHEIKKDKKCGILVFVLFLVFCALASISTWLYTRDLDPKYTYIGIENWIENDGELRKNLTELSTYLNGTNFNTSSIPSLLDLNENLDSSSLADFPIPTSDEFPEDGFPEDGFETDDDFFANLGKETN